MSSGRFDNQNTLKISSASAGSLVGRRTVTKAVASGALLMGLGGGAGKAGALAEGMSAYSSDGAVAEFTAMDAFAQAELVRNGDVTPLELVDAAIKRIEVLEPKLGFMAGFDFEGARQKARNVARDVPFAGVPTLVKDTLAYPGLRHSIGSRLFAGNIPTEGSEYTKRLDDAGFIVIGKSTTPEFALRGMTESVLEGITRNPWDLNYSPAGSSGGAASAVASGAVAIAHASDGGGSVRIPASACGLFGFKPSRGRNVPDQLVASDQPLSGLVEQHCVSRSVRDSALFLSVTEQRGELAKLAPVGFVADPIRRPLKIAYYTKTLIGGDADPEVRKALDNTAQLCRELGHQVEEVAPPAVDGQAASDAFFALAGFAMSSLDEMMAPMLGHSLNGTLLEDFTLELIEWYRQQPDDLLPRAQHTLEAGARVINDYFQRYDVALSPTLALLPQPIGRFNDLSRQQTIDFTETFAGYTPIHNQAGVPGMSVPLAWSESGLPIGSHFAARAGADALLLGLAYQLEEALPWGAKWPPISAL